MGDLLPCPFCGGEARLIRSAPDWYFPACMNRECACDWTDSYPTKAEAIEAWNTRAERTCKDVKPKLPYFKCDSCGMEDMGGHEIWIRDGFYHSQKPNYCPNCGAKVVDA